MENPGPTGSRGNVRLLWIIWTDNRFSDEHQTGQDFFKAVNTDRMSSKCCPVHMVPNLPTGPVILPGSIVLTIYTVSSLHSVFLHTTNIYNVFPLLL